MKPGMVSTTDKKFKMLLSQQPLGCSWGEGGACQFSSVQSLSCVQLFATPWTAAWV